MLFLNMVCLTVALAFGTLSGQEVLPQMGEGTVTQIVDQTGDADGDAKVRQTMLRNNITN
jgi:hypothetical protein